MGNENKEIEEPEEIENVDEVENTDSIEEISESQLDDFDDSMPEVTASAVDAHNQIEEAKTEIKTAYSHLKDKDGNSFNPDIHATNETGEPSLNKDGSLKKKRGRKVGTVINSKLNVPGNQLANSEPAKVVDYKGPALVTSQTIDGLLMAISPDFKPTPEEKEAAEGTWEEYYRMKDVQDIPPGIMLLGIYTSRFTTRCFDDEKYKDMAAKKQSVKKAVTSYAVDQKKQGFFAKLFGKKEKDINDGEKQPIENETK